MNDVNKPTGRKPPNAGMGRKKGVPNKNTALLKDAILKAAKGAGGKEGLVGYLKQQAAKNPGPFMGLLGKVLPMQVSGDPDNANRLFPRSLILPKHRHLSAGDLVAFDGALFGEEGAKVFHEAARDPGR
jgi:hypothetical protein